MREILEQQSVDSNYVYEFQIKSIELLQDSSSTMVIKFSDVNQEALFHEDRIELDWIPGEKYFPLFPRPSSNLTRSSSRGLVHLFERNKMIRSWPGERMFTRGRRVKMCAPLLDKTPSGELRLLPSDSLVIVLNASHEAYIWPFLSEDQIKTRSEMKQEGQPVCSFKARVVRKEEYDDPHEIPNSVIMNHSSLYCDSHPLLIDLILADLEGNICAALRFPEQSSSLSRAFHEGDMIVIVNTNKIGTTSVESEGHPSHSTLMGVENDSAPDHPIALSPFQMWFNLLELNFRAVKLHISMPKRL